MDKRPVVYVPTALRYTSGMVMYKIGYYVSKATLKSSFIECFEDGRMECQHKIRFHNIPNASKLYPNIYISQGDATVSKVFEDYASCKEFVDKQNARFTSPEGAELIARVPNGMKLHKQALKYIEELEQKYILVEERGQAREDIKSC